MVDFDVAPDLCPRCAAQAPSGFLCGRCRGADDRLPSLPDHAWWSGDLREALDARDIGKAIRAYRRHPHHGGRRVTQEDMARWLSITQGHLSRIEQGRVRVTNLETLSTYARILGIPPLLLWFELPPDRREPVSAPQRSSAALPDRLAAAIHTPTETQLADAMLSTLAGHSVRDQLAGPHDLIRVVRHDITFIDQRLAASRDGSNGRSRLRYAAGRYAELLGWLHQDCGDLDAAESWSRIALAHATATNDVQFHAYVLMRSSNIATDAGKISFAGRFIDQALLRADALTPQQRAVLLRQQANVYAARARSGERADVMACVEALTRAAEAAAEPAEERDDLAGYCSPAYVAMEAAQCWIELGNPEQALAILEQRMSDWSADSRRDLGMGLARLSTAHAGVGSWSEAVEFGGYAAGIVAETGSHRTLGQLRTTATVLHAAGQTGAARELTHHVRTAQRARASHGRSFEWS
ncbi:helix-turn-helix domain-containing protein [Nocardia abscessus]|uniref:helix-turn-helix domain-containing protein n=1 Tax=Nocardia abscessus TaxID=120957 RepID=UPI002456B133|nr:helix-turn-helix transcriptional regulator [Nocardia abscessus]